MESQLRPRELAKRSLKESRNCGREKALDESRRRFGFQPEGEGASAIQQILAEVKTFGLGERRTLQRLKNALASEEVNSEELFRLVFVGQRLHDLVKTVSTETGDSCKLLAVQVISNLCPLKEKTGLRLARAVGPYLITLLSSSSANLREASSVAIGNLALAGSKVVQVLLHQDALERLTLNLPSPDVHDAKVLEDGDTHKITSAALYALYHLFHSLRPRCSELGSASPQVSEVVLQDLTRRCVGLLCSAKTRIPLELYWVLFVWSCRQETHASFLTEENIIHSVIDVCTYEIFQKSDARPLVKVVTPLVRFLANLCGGPEAEKACLLVLRHPDLTAIFMALLGTNYLHLCRETLWLFANIVNNESVLVQEEIVEQDIIDKLEYHVAQVVLKVDPFAVSHASI